MPFINGIATGNDIKPFNYLVEPEQKSDLVHFSLHKKLNKALINYNPHPIYGRNAYHLTVENDFFIVNFPFPRNINFILDSAFLFERFTFDNYKFAEEYSIKVYNFFVKYSWLDIISKLEYSQIKFNSGETTDDINFDFPSLYNSNNYIFEDITIDTSAINKPFTISFYSPVYQENYIAETGFTVIEDIRENYPIVTNFRRKYEWYAVENDCIRSHYCRKWEKTLINGRFSIASFDLPWDILIGSLVIDFVDDPSVDSIWTEEEKNVILDQIPDYYLYENLDAFFEHLDALILQDNPFLLNDKLISTKTIYKAKNINFKYRNIYRHNPTIYRIETGGYARTTSERVANYHGVNYQVLYDRYGRPTGWVYSFFPYSWRVANPQEPPLENNFTFTVDQSNYIREFADHVSPSFPLEFGYLKFANNVSIGNWEFDYIAEDLGIDPVFTLPEYSVLGRYRNANLSNLENFVGLQIWDAAYFNAKFNDTRIPIKIIADTERFDQIINSNGLTSLVDTGDSVYIDNYFLLKGSDIIENSLNSTTKIIEGKHQNSLRVLYGSGAVDFNSDFSKYLYSSASVEVAQNILLIYSEIDIEQYTYLFNNRFQEDNLGYGSKFRTNIFFAHVAAGSRFFVDFDNINLNFVGSIFANREDISQPNILANADLGIEPFSPVIDLSEQYNQGWVGDLKTTEAYPIPFIFGDRNPSFTGQVTKQLCLPAIANTYSESSRRYSYWASSTNVNIDLDIDKDINFSYQNQHSFVPRISRYQQLEIEDKQVIIEHVIQQHETCYMANNCNCDELNEKLDKIIAALDANKFAFLDNSSNTQRTANIGYYVERIARVLGISVNSDGSIRSLRQSKLIKKGETLPNGWSIGQWARNQGGNTEGQTGGLESENRDGLAYEIRSNAFGIDPQTGEPNAVEEGGYALVENLPQLLEIVLNDLDRAIGWQDAGANVLPSADGSSIATYQGLNRMMLDILYNQSSMSRSTTGTHISSLKNQAMLQEVLAAFGLPGTIREVQVQIDKENTVPVPVPGIEINAPTMNDLLMWILLNLSLLVGTKFKASELGFPGQESSENQNNQS